MGSVKHKISSTSYAKLEQKKRKSKERKKREKSTVINVEQDRQIAAKTTTTKYRVLNQMLSFALSDKMESSFLFD